MSQINRRSFVGALAFSGLAADSSSAAPADVVAPKDVTRRLARYVVSSHSENIPAPVRKEAARTLLNWMGCAVGGSRHETVDIAIAALTPFSVQGQASILGRKERLSVPDAALMNGISSHI